MNIGKTGFKSAILASVIFNVLIISEEGFKKEVFAVLFISFFILLVISILGIAITIYPIYITHEKRLSKKQIFRTYFPYYAIILFTGCFWFYYITEFEKIGFLIAITTFFTAIYAWIDLFKENNNQILV